MILSVCLYISMYNVHACFYMHAHVCFYRPNCLSVYVHVCFLLVSVLLNFTLDCLGPSFGPWTELSWAEFYLG